MFHHSGDDRARGRVGRAEGRRVTVTAMTTSSGGRSAPWAAAGVEEVADGVHRVPLPLPLDGLHAVNVYAVLHRDGVTLVDGGWRVDPAREALRTALEKLGAAEDDVRRCLVTHMHRDHYSLATELRARAGTAVALGEGERPSLARLQDVARGERPDGVWGIDTRLFEAGAADLVAELRRHRRIDLEEARSYQDPDHWLADGARIDADGRHLRVLATPGHTAGHVAYVDDVAGLMFAGDHVLPHITPSIGFEPAPPTSPLADYLSSLARVLDEPDRVLLPAHGPAGGSVHRRVEELLEHHRIRLDQTLAAVTAEPGPALATTRLLRWTRHERGFAELDLFNRMLAVNETLAHLLVLRAQGRVDAEDGDGVLQFRPA